jgi:hypothetical protein
MKFLLYRRHCHFILYCKKAVDNIHFYQDNKAFQLHFYHKYHYFV